MFLRGLYLLSLPSSSGSLRLEIEYYARFFLKAIRSFLTFLAGLTELVKKSNVHTSLSMKPGSP